MAVSETPVVDTDLDPETDLDDEDIFSQMDENGIIGMDEVNEYYLQYHPRMEDSLETVEEDGEMMDVHNDPKLSGPAHPQDSVDDESFNISEFQDSDPAPLSAEEDPSPNHLMYESDPQEEDGILNNQDSKSFWYHEQDQQIDKTEDKEDLGTYNFQNKVVSGEQDEDEEGYAGLLFEEQPKETNPGMIGDSWGRYIKAPSILDHGDDFSVQRIRVNTEKLSDQSIESVNCSKTQGKDSSLSAQDYYSEDFETMFSNNVDHLGDVLELTHDSKGCASEIRKEGEDNSSSNHPVLHFNQVLLSHLSVEDLVSEADLEAETIPGSPCSDSVGESMGSPTKGRAFVKGSPDPGSGNTRQNDKIRQPQVSKAASNCHVKLTNHQKYPLSLSKPLILTDKNSQDSRQIKTLNPQRRTVNQRGSTKPLSRKITSETAIYGRGQLNYPLPDFSKVEPRVKFPKDEQTYQKPRSKTTSTGTSRNDPQLLVRSPADIVRQVLQSSNDCPLITPTPSGVKVVEEFKCPQQATEMVYQLQEDYRRLLTKYAEAENTIDRLRIGAKVNLFTDPPKPGHSFQGPSLNRPSKVMTFAISYPQKAELGPPLDSRAQTETHNTRELPGSSGGTPSQNDRTMEPTAGDCLTWALAQQAEALQKQMNIFEEFLKARKLASAAQLKAFQKLREGQDALERGYLQAREEYRSLQQKDTSASSYIIGKFDPNREVEGNIFRLGMRLEDVREWIDQVPETNAPTDHHSDEGASPNSWVTEGPAQQPARPMPMVQPPKPTLQTPGDAEQDPKHESLVLSATFQLEKVDVEVSSVSGDSENEDAIPRTLKRKKIQLEESFDQLLDQCESFKDLPLSLELDKVGRVPESPHRPPKALAQEMEKVEQMKGARITASYSDLDVDSRKTPEPRQPMKMQTMFSSGFKDLQQPVLDGEEMLPKVRSFRSHTISPDSEGAHLTERTGLSPGKSETCVDGIASPELVPCKTLFQAASVPLEERIVSPETDSGFVGSESSRITPAVRTPEHHRPLSRSQSQRETLLKSPGGAARAKQTFHRQEAPQGGVSDYRTIISQNRQRQESVAPTGLSRTSSPQQWAGSTVSEFEQETFVSHTESEADGLSSYAKQRCQHSSLVSSPLTFHPKVQYSSSPLNIRSARDELIQELQEEVSQLRHRLEQTLQKSQGDSEGTSPPAVARPRKHLVHQHSPRRKLSREDEEEGEGRTGNKSSASHNRSKSFPHFGSKLDINTESETSSSIPHPLTSKQASVSQTNKRPSSCKTQRSRPVKGPYAGTDYSFFVPWNSGQGCGHLPCPSCGGSPTEMADASTRTADFLTSSPRRNPCPACKGLGTDNKCESKRKPKPVTKEERRSSERHKGRGQRTVQMEEPPVAIGYIPPLYYVPHGSQVYYSAPAWTCTSSTQSHFYYPLGPKGLGSSLGARRSNIQHQQSSPPSDIPSVNGEPLTVLDLNSSLDQAIKAAKSMKWTTLKMVKSLTSDLCKAKAT
ncbi:microtubule organization protein AKNA isoform X2 [Pristis pectinata]|uniref:microtubule organization protein AKNA isoform X2 n=1 Tax=Pristis pectinata TaxID=685728 RepID=UPI00223DB5AD|nr:microtubule organization protein AKNA isoform X2 [Pristis pectinata]